ncbi:uncharacterized protein EI90DRAFT_3067496 [Cantharellus anzutake]|uniref:uncharacterized protein n=1 Tax=Cantharellus anzutake TaxID=1750568 RepID=UPI001904AD21|nr:uncharacterized protein EI90DRAFT_3067496 [Cantharellus anzutake]KAF8327376.1 hypothetical protein EI90DRAFT_3067496 [Cantharellus anzutake]
MAWTEALIWVAILSYGWYRLSWNLLRRYFISNNTALDDIELLGKAPPAQKIPGTVVIAGGSFSGYVSARILADYFQTIVLIDPESGVVANGRVPQRPLYHLLLAISLKILRKLYPSFDNEAPKDDVYIFPGVRHWWIGRNYFGDFKSKRPEQIGGSRISIERLCRRLSIAYCGKRLQVIQGTVTGLKASPDKTTIQSVSYRSASPSSEAPTTKATSNTIPCILFVDCAGPSTIGSKLLPAASEKWGPYTRTSYNPNAKHYAASFLLTPETQEKVSRALPKDDRSFGRWDKCAVIGAFSPTPEISRDLFAYQRIEGNRLLIGYSGWNVDSCPKTLAQYIETARQLHNKSISKERHQQDEWLFDVLRLLGEDADILDEPIQWDGHTMTSSFWIDYGSKTVPNNFIAIGDSVMGVNPIFGQGVAKLLYNATVLNSILQKATTTKRLVELPKRFARSYFDRILRIDKGMFDTNRILDYGYESTVPQPGETLETGKGFRRYFEALLHSLAYDPSGYEIFVHVFGGFSPGIDLLTPSFIFKSFFWMWWSPPRASSS